LPTLRVTSIEPKPSIDVALVGLPASIRVIGMKGAGGSLGAP
jgi:hypothetical protein